MRLVAAVVAAQGGQVTVTTTQQRAAPASFSVWEDPATGDLVLTAGAVHSQQIDTEVEQCQEQQSSS